MKRELYKADRQSYLKVSEYKGESVTLEVSRVTPRIAGFKDSLLWNVTCLGRIKAYCLYKDDVLVHRSYVVRGRSKFPFLGRSDIEIGPCWTKEAFRGRGYYPFIISKIIESELSRGGTAYMIVNNENSSSQQGITKVGFRKTEYVVTKDILKRQILKKNIDGHVNEQ